MVIMPSRAATWGSSPSDDVGENRGAHDAAWRLALFFVVGLRRDVEMDIFSDLLVRPPDVNGFEETARRWSSCDTLSPIQVEEQPYCRKVAPYDAIQELLHADTIVIMVIMIAMFVRIIISRIMIIGLIMAIDIIH